MLPFELLDFTHQGTIWHVEYRSQRDGSFKVRIAGNEIIVRVLNVDAESLRLDIDGKRLNFRVHHRLDEWHIHTTVTLA